VNRVERGKAAKRLATDEHAAVHRVAALLLDYPDEELVAQLPAIHEVVNGMSARFREPLTRLVSHLARVDVREAAAHYVATFDHRKRCCLFLTYYAHGDTRNRGVALVTFKQAYRAAGVELAQEELPDHLCVVLEFAATTDRVEGIRLLLAHRAGLELLRIALLEAGSPYADALVAVCGTLPPLEGDELEAVARLAADGPPEEEVGLDPYSIPQHQGARP